MAVLAIDLSDAGLHAARSGQAGLLAVDGEDTSSPGCALVGRQALVTGAAAARRAWLQPLDLNDRFWDRLDTQPADPRDPRSPNHAEVACAHLRHVLAGLLDPGDEVVMAVPVAWDRRQLGYLVGIAEELGCPLRALVVRPIAFAPDPVPTGPALVIELSRHRATLSVIGPGEATALTWTRDCPDVGLNAFRQQWVKAISDEFVRTTRFDPLHDAVTEQRLDDDLPAALDGIARDGSYELRIETGTLAHRTAATRQMLAHAGHGLIVRLCSDVQAAVKECRPAVILLAHEAGRIPGLPAALDRQFALPVQILGAGAAARGLARLWPEQFEVSEAGGVAHHTRRGPAPPPPAPAAAAAAATAPTHLLVGGRAHALGGDPVYIDCDRGSDTLTIGAGAGVASVRRSGQEVIVDIAGEGEVRVDGAEVRSPRAVGPGAKITVSGCSGEVTLITLSS